MIRYIVGNWKMHPKNLALALRLVRRLVVRPPANTRIVLCPPSVYLGPLVQFSKRKFFWGAQDCFWEPTGTYTGEVSAPMLRELGAQYAIIGHSERRDHLNETDEIVRKKTSSAITAGLVPIVCIGGGRAAKSKKSNAKAIAGRQLLLALADKSAAAVGSGKLLVAYEPPWAISNVSGNRPAPTALIEEMMRFIHLALQKKYGPAARSIPLLYGGSVNAESRQLGKIRGLNGFLVGGASLDPAAFNQIINF